MHSYYKTIFYIVPQFLCMLTSCHIIIISPWQDIEDISCVVCPWHHYKISLITGEGYYQVKFTRVNSFYVVFTYRCNYSVPNARAWSIASARWCLVQGYKHARKVNLTVFSGSSVKFNGVFSYIFLSISFFF